MCLEQRVEKQADVAEHGGEEEGVGPRFDLAEALAQAKTEHCDKDANCQREGGAVQVHHAQGEVGPEDGDDDVNGTGDKHAVPATDGIEVLQEVVSSEGGGANGNRAEDDRGGPEDECFGGAGQGDG